MFDPTAILVARAAKKIMSDSDSQELAKLEDAGVEFAANVTGAPGKELGEWFADHIRYWRLKSQVKIIEKAQKVCDKHGIAPQRVKTNVLVPLLEQGSLEEDESMQEMWAALLANAASPDSEAVQPGFVTILGQLTPLDAEVLTVIRMYCQLTPVATGLTFRQVCAAPALAKQPDERVDLSLQNLERLGLVSYMIVQRGVGAFPGGFPMPLVDPANTDSNGQEKSTRMVFFTTLGQAFISACSEPQSMQATN